MNERFSTGTNEGKQFRGEIVDVSFRLPWKWIDVKAKKEEKKDEERWLADVLESRYTNEARRNTSSINDKGEHTRARAKREKGEVC